VLAEALLEYETLEGGEIDLLFAGKPLDRPPPASTAERRRTDTKAPKAERAPIFPRPLADPEKA